MYIVLKRAAVAGPNGLRPVTGGTNPAVHPTEELAVGEAERLCAANPMHEFLIFQGIAVAKTTSAPVETVRL